MRCDTLSHAPATPVGEKVITPERRRTDRPASETDIGVMIMTYENVRFLDQAANLAGALTLLTGLVFGAAMFVVQSI